MSEPPESPFMKRSAWLTAVLSVWIFTSCSDDPSGPPPPPPVEEADITLDPSKDNTLFEDPAGQLSNGSGTFIFAGMTVDSLSRRALIHFDVAGSAIPAGSTIDSAQLVLRMDRTIVGDISTAIHRVTADWGEGSSDAAFAEGMGIQAETGDATWVHRFFDTSTWTTPGGDFVAAPSATQTVGDEVRTYAWGSTNQMVQDVQGWLDDGANNLAGS